MNQELMKLLHKLDNSTHKMSEYTISSKINSVTKEDDSIEAISERMAFSFNENYENNDTGWGTYLGPMMVWRNDDGKTYESPSLSLVTEEILTYWINRAKQTNNFLMQARYYGLVWDLMYRITNKNPNYEIAKGYINALIQICKKDLCEHPTEAIQKITRAYNLARSLNNIHLINECINAAIELEDKIAEDDKPGLWGFCFELFVLGKEKFLSETQKTKLILDLEDRLKRISQQQSPWVCESAGIPLANYYRKIGKNEDVKRIIELVGNCFENACEGQAPMLASSWYQHLYSIYSNFGLRDKADEVSKKISEVGPKVVESMQSFSHSTEIPIEKLNAYLEAIIEGGLDESLKRIAIHFIPQRGKVEQQVLELANNYPISFLFTKILQDDRGRPVATIGGMEDDLEGNIIHQMSQNMGIESFFLRHSFNKLKETYNPTPDDISNYILKSPIFDKSKIELIEKGISAFLDEKYIESIHILVPQAEAAIRNLVELSGGAILRKNRHGGFQLRTFDDLLRDDIVARCFGEDLTFYIRILLTDQRGWNIRNDVCHGISQLDAFNYSVADRVMHVMLCLSLARENKA